jgi:hypothetical protein
METVLNYDNSAPRGHLEILKLYPDGREEVHFSEQNVITSGMGHTLLKAFSNTGLTNISGYQIVYFQLGVSGAPGLQVSGTGELSSALSESDYATANFQLSIHDLSSGTGAVNQPFGVIPFAYIKKISPSRVMYQIFVGEDACNEQTINEIGLFSRNPDGSSTDGSYLCAYRYFTPLAKQDSFSVLFRWTIEF